MAALLGSAQRMRWAPAPVPPVVARWLVSTRDVFRVTLWTHKSTLPRSGRRCALFKLESNSTTSGAMPRYYFRIVGPADLRDRFGLFRCVVAVAFAWVLFVAVGFLFCG